MNNMILQGHGTREGKKQKNFPDDESADLNTEGNNMPPLICRKHLYDSDTECEQTMRPRLFNKSSVSFAKPLVFKIKQVEKTRESKVDSSIGSTVDSKTCRHSLSKKTRELSTNNKSRDDSGNVKPSTSQPFADIASIELRRGKRPKKRS